MAYSIAIHLALFLIADSLLRARTQPSIISTPLVVRIESPQTTGEVVDDRRAVPSAETEVSKPAETSRPSRPTDSQPQIAEAVAMVVAAEITPTGLEQATENTRAETRADGENVAAVDVVTTNSIAKHVAVVRPPQAAPPELEQTTFSSRQEEMLNRKVRDWTEKLHRMPEVASGLRWNDKGQEYVARFTELPARNDMGIERVVVEISTEQDGQRLSSEVHLKRLAFSNYAQFVNRWDPNVEIYNDALAGRFHSNTEINVAYDRKVRPLFEGKVTTTSRQVNYTKRRGSTNRAQIFAGGLQTGVRRIGLPKRFLPFPDEGDIADDQVHRFAEDTRITFHADGAFAWQSLDAASPELVGTLSDGTTYLIAGKRAELHVKGTVNGKVLVYSPERIVIEDDLVYAQSPEESSDADDYVGLVSDKNVDVASPEITGSGDLLINAAIYAKRRFAVRRFRAGEGALLYLYGSLTAGSISATEPRYYTRIQFDQRLENLRPPGFPMTDRYEVESWDETWNVEPIE
jgi:hypothetical protein